MYENCPDSKISIVFYLRLRTNYLVFAVPPLQNESTIFFKTKVDYFTFLWILRLINLSVSRFL